MNAAKGTKLFQLQPLGLRLLIFGLAIVLVFAFRALQCDDFTHRLLLFRSQNPEVRIQNAGAQPF
jgi:hypothetical protein